MKQAINILEQMLSSSEEQLGLLDKIDIKTVKHSIPFGIHNAKLNIAAHIKWIEVLIEELEKEKE